MSELLPCPFCGKSGKVVEYHGSAHRQYRVRCSDDYCNKGTHQQDKESDAVIVWNTRTQREQP